MKLRFRLYVEWKVPALEGGRICWTSCETHELGEESELHLLRVAPEDTVPTRTAADTGGHATLWQLGVPFCSDHRPSVR